MTTTKTSHFRTDSFIDENMAKRAARLHPNVSTVHSYGASCKRSDLSDADYHRITQAATQQDELYDGAKGSSYELFEFSDGSYIEIYM